MADAYLGEIRLFAGNYAPKNWAFCQGQLYSISQFTPLYSVVGTIYGGNGTTNFALPNLEGRLPMSAGNGFGLTPRRLGQQLGYPTVTLTAPQLAAHNHLVNAENSPATSPTPDEDSLPAQTSDLYSNDTPGQTTLNAESVSLSGGNDSHLNLMLTTALHYIICIDGLYPPHP